jgi:hypothetical protein
MNENATELAQRIRALADKRAREAGETSDPALQQRLQEVSANYQALADEVARQNDLPPLAPASDPVPLESVSESAAGESNLIDDENDVIDADAITDAGETADADETADELAS